MLYCNVKYVNKLNKVFCFTVFAEMSIERSAKAQSSKAQKYIE